MLCEYRLRKIASDWPSYKTQTLSSSLDYIQQRFTSLEQTSFRALEELLDKTCIVHEMSNWQGHESRCRIFRDLLEFPFSSEKQARGIAIYNRERECVAWRGWVFLNLSPPCLEEALNGGRFSVIAYSEERVYAVLCTFAAIRHEDANEYMGVAIAFLPLDTNYTVSTEISGIERYITSRSFSEEILKQQPFIKNVKIHFDDTATPSPGSLQAPLRNLDGARLCAVTITAHSREIVQKKITQDCKKFQRLILALFICIACLIGARELFLSSLPKWAKYSSALTAVWSVRYILHRLDFPSSLLPNLFVSPSVFYFPSLGRAGNTLAELMVTACATILTSYIWIRWMPLARPLSSTWGRGRLRYSLLPGQVLLLSALLLTACYGCQHFFYKIVLCCNFHLFAHFLPSTEVLCIYVVALLIGVSAVLLVAWGLSVIPLSARPQWLENSIVTVSVATALIWQVGWGHIPWPVSSVSTLSFVAAALFYLKGFPRRYRLYHFFVMGLVALGTYTILNHAARDRMRVEVEDYAETSREENFVPDRIREGLDTFEFEEIQHQKLLAAIEQEQSNIAFLLWANSNLVALDNVEIFVYKNIADPTGQRRSYSELSKFSLNMPLSQLKWYRTLMSRLDPEVPQIIQGIPGDSIPGYGSEARNVLFCVAGTPVRNSKEEIVGFVVVLTRYQKLLQTFPLPEIFSTKNLRRNIPLLMAYFEGQTMLDIGDPYLSKNFRPSAKVAQLVEQEGQKLWVEESVEGREYENFYFPMVVPKIATVSEGEDRFETKVAMIGYEIPTLFSRIFYFLQFFLAGAFFLILPLWAWTASLYLLRHPRLRQTPYFHFEQKILMAFLVIAGIPLLVMGILNKDKAVAQVWQSYEKNLMEYLENAEKSMREEGYIALAANMPDENFCRSWGARNHRMLNVYLEHRLCATNRPEFFQIELLSPQMSGEAFYNLMLLKRDIYVALEPMANYSFVVGYKALSSPQDKRVIVGALAIPMVYKYAEVEREVAEKIALIVTISIGIFSLVVITAIVLAHQITRPLAKLIGGIHRVSAGELDFQLSVRSRDEFGQLVEAFNAMTRDLKLSREKLIQAEKDAAWREMARQIAHEIKNPLTPMKLSAQHIRKAYSDHSPKFEQILEKGTATIIDAIESLSQTASSFSEFARFSRPNLLPQPIYPLLEECLHLFSHYRENVSFHANFEPDLPQVSTDAYHLKRILINVLTNAVQAVEGKSGLIEISCRRDTAKMLMISVTDNGCGIPEHLQPNLFEPNFSTKSHGSGLGLAICKRTIDKMKGTISIESREGVGTTVNIQIPVSR